MNNRQKYFSTCLLATAALFGSSAASAQAPAMGVASKFAVLGGTNVTCTAGSVVGDAGVSPGSAVSFSNTGCVIAGGIPPATNIAAAQARTDFLTAYNALQLQSTTCTQLTGTLAGDNLAPGVYCVDTVAKTGLLTLTGPADGVWIFLVNGALTGTNFSVVMGDSGQPCNVFWAPTGATTLTTSAFKGNILAGDAAMGSITLTGGTLAGRALANGAVTMTGTSVIGCKALAGTGPGSGPGAPPSCDGNNDNDDEDDEDEDDDHESDKDDKDQSKNKYKKNRGHDD